MSETTERDAVADRFYSHHYRKPLSSVAIDQLVIADMADHIVRLERILAALREPSDAVVDAATEAFADYDDMRRGVHAAVAAAEKEVGG